MTTQFEILTKTAVDLCTSILSQQQQQISSPITSLISSLSSTTISSPSSSPSSSSSEEQQATPSIHSIRLDFIQLSTHLGKESTSLTLACKPPLTLLAVEGTLKNLINLLSNFQICLGFCNGRGSLSKEIRWIAYELTEALQRLLESSLECHLTPSKQKSISLRTLNLTLTGQVWEKVTLATTSLSLTELESTRKEWKSILELIDDCLEEVKEMEESDSSRSSEVEDEGYEEEGDEAEEEEDEDDYRNHHPLSLIEKERVKATHMLLRLGRLLLKRLITSTTPIKPSSSTSTSTSSSTISTSSKPSTSKSLSSSTTTTTSSSSPSSTSPKESPYSSPSFLLSTSPLVQSLSSTADDLAASLEPPQSQLSSTSKKFERAGLNLCDLIESILSSPSTSTTEGKGNEEVKEEVEVEELRWFKMWRDQVGKARLRLDSLGGIIGEGVGRVIVSEV